MPVISVIFPSLKVIREKTKLIGFNKNKHAVWYYNLASQKTNGGSIATTRARCNTQYHKDAFNMPEKSMKSLFDMGLSMPILSQVSKNNWRICNSLLQVLLQASGEAGSLPLAQPKHGAVRTQDNTVMGAQKAGYTPDSIVSRQIKARIRAGNEKHLSQKIGRAGEDRSVCFKNDYAPSLRTYSTFELHYLPDLAS